MTVCHREKVGEAMMPPVSWAVARIGNLLGNIWLDDPRK